MSGVPPVAAIPANLLDQALRDPRVIEAAMRAGVSLRNSAELAALLTRVPKGTPPKLASEPEGVLGHQGASLLDTARSRRPEDAIRAYQSIASLID